MTDLARLLERRQAELAALQEEAMEEFHRRRIAVRYLYQWHKAGR